MANVQNGNITFSGFVLDGSVKDNYTLTQPTVSASITAMDITVTGTTATKVYNDDENFTATDINIAGATLTGKLNNNNLTLVKDNATGSFVTAELQNGNIVFSGFTPRRLRFRQLHVAHPADRFGKHYPEGHLHNRRRHQPESLRRHNGRYRNEHHLQRAGKQ
jgi:hypothetical protein